MRGVTKKMWTVRTHEMGKVGRPETVGEHDPSLERELFVQLEVGVEEFWRERES